MQRRRGQRTRIDETDASSIGELERCAGMAREWIIDPANLPVTRHPEVHVNRASIVESQELMLPTAIDARDYGTGKGAEALRRQSASQGRMKKRHT